jgi:hypothetical protein
LLSDHPNIKLKHNLKKKVGQWYKVGEQLRFDETYEGNSILSKGSFWSLGIAEWNPGFGGASGRTPARTSKSGTLSQQIPKNR